MNLFELGSIAGALCGAIGLALALAAHGAFAVILGILAGLVGGWFVGPLVVLCVFVVAICVSDGPRAAVRFVRKRRVR